jgi:zinc protease
MRIHPFRRSLVALALLAAPAAAQSAHAAKQAPLRAMRYTRVALPNGLVALLNEDHTAPLVSVQVWYHIGSKNDKAGRAGMAHLCEHAQGLGSPNEPLPQRAFYPSIGGTSPHYAQTTEDVTEYYIIIPPNQLETALWAEADRMAAPFSQLTDTNIDGVRAVVAQERSQNIENLPYGVAREIVTAQLFPLGNPYHLVPLPPMADLYNATPSDLRSACAPYYVPNNAAIALSGDFSTASAKKWIEKYFGPIKRAAAAPVIAVPKVAPTAERRLVLEDARANQPRIQFNWIGASYADPDRLALLALASSLSLSRFGGGPPPLGRLTKALTIDRPLATAVIADNSDLEKSGIFEILVFPRAGASLSAIESVVDSTLADLATHPITAAELTRFQSYNAVAAVTSLQTRFARSDTLVHDFVFTGDPTAYAKQAAATRALTPRDLDRVAAKYLTKSRVVMSLVPKGKLDLISKPERPYVNVTPASSERAGARP